MAEQKYVLSGDAVTRIGRAVIASEHLDYRPRLPPQVASPLLVLVAKTGAGGIPAMSGDTPGSGPVTIKKMNDDGDFETVINPYDASDVTMTVYNIASSVVAASVYIQVKQESSSGKLIVDFEDCG